MSNAYIARTSEVAARMLGDEIMIMSARDSTLFCLNEVGSAIWRAADGCTPLAQIVERAVCGEFEVSLDVALADAQDFVQELSEHGILLVSDQPIPAPPWPPQVGR